MSILAGLFARRLALIIIRMIRRLLVVALVLAILGVIANIWVAHYAERKAGQQIQTALKLSSRPDVSLDAFPILLRVLQGRIPGMTIKANDVEIRGLVLSRFEVTVEDLQASISDFINGRGKFRVGGGRASGETSAASVNRYLAAQERDAVVVFLDGRVQVRAHATYQGKRRTLDATGPLAVDGTDLIFTAQQVTVDGGPPPPALVARARRDSSFRVALPSLPGGVHARRITVTRTSARLDVEFKAITLDLAHL